jgi:hypothetical protein
VQGKLLELVEKVETLEILGVRDFLLQTDSPIETLSRLWDDIDWEMNRMSIPDLRRQERVCSRGSPVPCSSQHGDGLEELEPTD